MQYAKLGRTGLKVSRLCLGTMNFGPHSSEKESFAIMDKALELGINFFDTANVYGWKKGEGITEQIIGRWFAQGGGWRFQACASEASCRAKAMAASRVIRLPSLQATSHSAAPSRSFAAATS